MSNKNESLADMILDPALYATAPVLAERDAFTATLPGGMDVTFTRRPSGWDVVIDVDVRLTSGVRVGVIRGRMPTDDVRVLWSHLSKRAFVTQEEIQETALSDVTAELKALTGSGSAGSGVTT